MALERILKRKREIVNTCLVRRSTLLGLNILVRCYANIIRSLCVVRGAVCISISRAAQNKLLTLILEVSDTFAWPATAFYIIDHFAGDNPTFPSRILL